MDEVNSLQRMSDGAERFRILRVEARERSFSPFSSITAPIASALSLFKATPAPPPAQPQAVASLPPPPPTPSVQPQPQPQSQSQQPQSQEQQQPVEESREKSSSAISGGTWGVRPEEDVDYTKIPAVLDQRFEILDEDSALRPTIIKPGNVWEKRAQKALLANPVTETLTNDELKKEKNKAFDLLDALSRSGVLSIDSASLHVVLAATHCFDKSLMNTVIQDNMNPIEKVERSTLIVASTVQNKMPMDLIKDEHIDRVQTYSPMLFGPEAVFAIEDKKA